MIIYDKQSLKNLHVQEEAAVAHDAGLLNLEELTNIKKSYRVGFYTTSIFSRAGFFILTCIGGLFGGCFLTLLFDPIHVINYAAWPIFLGVCSYGLLEFITIDKRLYHSGTDDALLWQSLALLTGGAFWAADKNSNQFLIASAFVLVLSLWLTIRLAKTLMASFSSLSLLAFVFFAWIKIGPLGEATMPFVIMICSGLIYYVVYSMENNYKAFYYRKCLMFMQATSLVMLYAAGNYLIVQKLGNQMHHLPADSNNPLPLGWFFWAWTFLLPILYILLGIKKKDLLLLRLGLLLVAAAAYTFRFYFHVLDIEYVLVITGAIFVPTMFWLIRFLKTPKFGFTYAQRGRRHWINQVNLESLVVAGAASHTPVAPVESTSRFGGGSFGGAGASSDF
jgi:hypothetical protein